MSDDSLNGLAFSIDWGIYQRVTPAVKSLPVVSSGLVSLDELPRQLLPDTRITLQLACILVLRRPVTWRRGNAAQGMLSSTKLEAARLFAGGGGGGVEKALLQAKSSFH